MRGGLLIGLNPDMWTRAAALVVSLGGVKAGDPGRGVAQIEDATGRLFTMYESLSARTDWALDEGPFTVADGVQLPDMGAVIGCDFECRSPDYVAEIARAIALANNAPTWLLDSDDVVWDARHVDPSAVTL